MAVSRNRRSPSATGVAGIGGRISARAGVTSTVRASAITRRIRTDTQAALKPGKKAMAVPTRAKTTSVAKASMLSRSAGMRVSRPGRSARTCAA